MLKTFNTDIASFQIPDKLVLFDGNQPHELCQLAVAELQEHLKNSHFFDHNFGLTNEKQTVIIGKMFGVLVVQSSSGLIGYLSAFSGKLGGKNNYPEFVPTVFDLLTEGSFLNTGMQELTKMNIQINDGQLHDMDLKALKATRRLHSIALQKQIFEHYHLLNYSGDSKSLNTIFLDAGYKSPPAGAAECAGIKLLQYAFLNQMKPLALAEFWWGQSPKSDTWKHGKYYPCCKEKCAPILQHMLS
jgi:tRNA pseudouridine32 synthase/23S rRNA pseudouridine746 synthase